MTGSAPAMQSQLIDKKGLYGALFSIAASNAV